ncbi:MAG: hypothetical protein JO069_03465 [Verrucomicrobia bacterium]|nr:hypothetical protein [Verrucomicrobiota bacterium]
MTTETSKRGQAKGRVRRPSPLEQRFLFLFEKVGGDPAGLEREYRFSPPRRWRSDFYHAPSRSLIELEGGLYGIVGKHNRIEGVTADCEKYNAAVALGYRVYRLTARLLEEKYVQQLYGWLT